MNQSNNATVEEDTNIKKPSMTERAKDMYDISKEHIKGAVRNQGTGMEDVNQRDVPLSQVAREHGREAMKDMKQWSKELSDTAKGNPSKETEVRDIPPMEGKDEHVQDRTVKKPTTTGRKTEEEENTMDLPGSWVNPPSSSNPPSSNFPA